MRLTMILLLLFLVSFKWVVAQNPCAPLYGEWVSGGSIPEAMIKERIILKPSYKYVVFNNRNIIPPLSKKDTAEFRDTLDSGYGVFMMDNDGLKAITERGKWDCDISNDSIFISFYKRNRHKNSNIARFYGKGDSVSIYLKELTNRKLVLCQYDAGTEPNCYMCPPEVEEEGGCYTYRKYKESDYKIVSKVLKGSGPSTDSLALSGSETEIKLQYGFYSEADRLSLRDLQDSTIFSTKMRKTDSLRKEQITIRGVTRLKIDVKSSEPDSKWKLKFDIY